MTYQIDPKHSGAQFQVRHMGIANVKGEFGLINGTVEFDPASPEAARLDVSIDIGSLHTRDEARDGHIKGGDFLDAENHSAITYKSTKVAKAGDGYSVDGNLTIRGITNPVTLNVSEVSKEVTDPWGMLRRGATATAQISRKAFGMGFNAEVPGAGPMISDEVAVTLDIEFTRAAS